MSEYDCEFLQKFLEISKRLEKKKDTNMIDIYNAHSFRQLAENDPIQAIMSIHARVCNLALSPNGGSGHKRAAPETDQLMASNEYRSLRDDLFILAQKIADLIEKNETLKHRSFKQGDLIADLMTTIETMQADIQELKALTHKERLEADNNNFEIDI